MREVQIMCHVFRTHVSCIALGTHSAEIIMDMERDDQVNEYVMNGDRQMEGGREG